MLWGCQNHVHFKLVYKLGFFLTGQFHIGIRIKMHFQHFFKNNFHLKFIWSEARDKVLELPIEE